jgi:transposase
VQQVDEPLPTVCRLERDPALAVDLCEQLENRRGVVLDAPRKQLCALIVGEVTRFANARKLCSWAGMMPTVHSSDQRTRLGHISRQGSPTLRWALVEAAQHAARGGGPLRESFERIAKRRGRQVAKVAVARKILTLCFYGLRDGEIRCLAPRAAARTVRTMAVAS